MPKIDHGSQNKHTMQVSLWDLDEVLMDILQGRASVFLLPRTLFEITSTRSERDKSARERERVGVGVGVGVVVGTRRHMKSRWY